jgi:alanyl aminopeptidase
VPAPPVIATTETPPPATSDALSPPQPTLRLPRNFVPTAYDIKLDIDPAKDRFTGHVAITGKVSERSSVIWLHGYHLAIEKASAGATPLTVTPKGEDLLEVKAATPLEAGEQTLVFDYSGELDKSNTTGMFKQVVNGQAYVFSQLEAFYARRVFPSFDEPNVKVPFKLALRVPKAMVTAANTPMVKETPVDDKTKLVEFGVTKPLPTYLLAFVVGPFDVVDAGKSKRGTPIRIITLAKRGGDAAYAAQTTARILDAVEDYFGIPYPYEKLDMATIPLTVGFSAMENAGLITTTESSMLMDPARPSHERRLEWFGTAAHEIAHQWFGDLVTPMYWDDIWLNEGFATWLGSKITAQLEPAWRGDAMLLEMRHWALGADSLVSARKIRQPIESINDIQTAFDGITYVKGASILRMFELYVGEDVFQKGIREYLSSHALGNATNADFVAAISKASGKPMIESAFSSFLDQAGAPELTATTTCSGGKVSVELAQKRYVPVGAPEPAAATPWQLPVCFAYEKGGKRAEQCTLLDKASATVALATKTCPRWLMPNAGGRGYYRNAYTVQQVTALRDEGWAQLTPGERRAIHYDLRAAATNGKLPLQLVLSFTPRLIAGSTDRYNVQAALVLPESFNETLPDDLRPKYEFWLRQQFGSAANGVGFTSKDTDTLDIEESRGHLLGAVAWTAREPTLVAEAVRLAEKWRELPDAIRGTVLSIAADAKPEVFDKLMREISTEPSRELREAMVKAIGSVREPARYKAALSLVLEPKVDVREVMWMPFFANTEVTRDIAKEFVRANKDAILARLPNAGTASAVGAQFAYVFTATCKADQRDAIADYVTKTFGSMQGGERTVKQAIESMDQCIAKRKILDPEIRAWLGGLKLPQAPKPAPAKAK